MGTVHELIEARGRLAALQTDTDRRVIEAASAFLGDEDNGVGFIFSGWCQTALPHRRIPEDQVWQVTSDRVTLLVEPGRRPREDGEPAFVGVPYGSRARLILLYLQGEALRTGCREVELGRSLRDWLTRLGIPVGGKSMNEVREQAERISRCRLTFHFKSAGGVGLMNQNIMDTALFLERDPDLRMREDARQGSLFVERATLSERFFEQLRKHPVPLQEAAIRALTNNSLSLDIYCWLAYRLHALPAPRAITWTALQGQFGSAYRKSSHFKPRFTEALNLATAVYPGAQVDVDERGLTLRPSRPPVAPRTTAIR